MMIVLTGIGCLFMGFFMIMLTKLNPLFERVYFDYIGMFVLFLPFVILLYRMMSTNTYSLVEKIPKWKHFIAYMRRDNTIVPMIGNRTYPGESFLDVAKLGLVEFLGKDCWYTWGDKKILWGLIHVTVTYVTCCPLSGLATRVMLKTCYLGLILTLWEKHISLWKNMITGTV